MSAAHLLATGVLAQASSGAVTAETVMFWVFAVIGVGAGIAMITMRNIVHAALMLVVNFIAIAALFLALQSSFLAVIQVIVYAGAIMVLFLFVIMLLGVDRDDLLDVSGWHRGGAIGLTVLVAAAALFAFAPSLTSASSCRPPSTGAAADAETLNCRGLDQALSEADDSSVVLLAERLFNRYTFPFEAAALLLAVATIGAILLGRREDLPPSEDPAHAPSGPVPDAADARTARADAERVLEAPDGADDEQTSTGPVPDPGSATGPDRTADGPSGDGRG